METINTTIKYIILTAFMLVSHTSVASAQELSAEVLKQYQDERYETAAKLLEDELKLQKEKGLESSDLYYNLGNAYFRDNEIAKAILNYERAALINSGDNDIRHNLEFARTKTEDKIVSVESFFLQSWFDSIQNLQSSNAWAKLSIVLFLMLMASLGVFFFTNSIFAKKITFYVGIVSLLFLLLTNVFSYSQKSKIDNRNAAVIMVGSASVTNSPDDNAKELFVLHAGTKVTINKRDGSWMEIEIDNGNVGWVNKDKLEII